VVSLIFCSHSGAENRPAVALKTWLCEKRRKLTKNIVLDSVASQVPWVHNLRQAQP
jgi:hypothetical protein